MFITRTFVVTLVSFFLTSNSWAADLPEQCIQLPQRTEVCPNLMYKRANVQIEATNTQVGEIVCICMADFESLRIRALTEPEKSQQAVTLARAAASLGISEAELIALIRN